MVDAMEIITARPRCTRARNEIFERIAISIDGGGHVHECTLPGLAPRYLTRAPGFNPGRDLSHSLNAVSGLRARACGLIYMQSNLLRAPARGTARSDLLERQLRRYCPRSQGAVRALAMRHPRIADLAASFPALLFALAVP